MSSTQDKDHFFDEEVIRRAMVPRWKYWLLPLTQPIKWRQVKWTFEDETGRKHVMRGLLRNHE